MLTNNVSQPLWCIHRRSGIGWNIRVLLFEVDNGNNKAIEGKGQNTTHNSIVSLEAILE